MMLDQGYDLPPYRPPNEAGSVLVRFTRGCPWNKCMFCEMYKDREFERKSLDVIKNDIDRAREVHGPRRTIFIGDSDSLVLKDLPDAVRYLRKVFPEVVRVTTYARARTIVKRSVDFLREVHDAGLDRLHIGLESGDAGVLEMMGKGATPRIMIEGGKKAKDAGYEISEYVLSGAGGPDGWVAHALNSAKVLNEIDPDFIRLRTLTLQRGAPLWRMWQMNEFILTPPLERLREVEMFIGALDVQDCELHSDHMTNYIWSDGRIVYNGVGGRLPGEKDAMLEKVRVAVRTIEEGGLKVEDSNDLYISGRMIGL